MEIAEPVVAYVALGSNLGDRFGHLQAAVAALEATRGIDVVSVSPVYENPAQPAPGDSAGGAPSGTAAAGAPSGTAAEIAAPTHTGDGARRPDFLNAVAALETTLAPRALLDRLLSIEAARGRTRDAEERWQDRTLDLDLLVFAKSAIDEEGLVVPHPRMAGRRFVLRPLADIAPFLRLPPPVNADVVDLLARCPDSAHLTPFGRELRVPGRGSSTRQAELWPEAKAGAVSRPSNRLPQDLRYIVVEGVIGVGKTTLAREISRRFGAGLIVERFDENPFLARFYEDRARWSFQTQLAFLASRFQQQQTLARRDLFHELTVSDYAFDKDRIFARLNLSGDELQLYETMFAIMQPSVPRPDLIVYLQSTTERLLAQIRSRGRAFESNMDPAYIESLNEAYNAYFFHYTQSPLLIVNATRLDFVKNPADLDELLRQIARIQPAGTTYFNPARPA